METVEYLRTYIFNSGGRVLSLVIWMCYSVNWHSPTPQACFPSFLRSMWRVPTPSLRSYDHWKHKSSKHICPWKHWIALEIDQQKMSNGVQEKLMVLNELYCLRIDAYWLGIRLVDYLTSSYKEALGSIPRTMWQRIIFTKVLKMCSSGNTSFMTLCVLSSFWPR